MLMGIRCNTSGTQHRDDTAGPWQWHHRQSGLAHLQHQPRAGVTDGRCTRITHISDTCTLLQALNHRLCSLHFIVLVNR